MTAPTSAAVRADVAVRFVGGPLDCWLVPSDDEDRDALQVRGNIEGRQIDTWYYRAGVRLDDEEDESIIFLWEGLTPDDDEVVDLACRALRPC